MFTQRFSFHLLQKEQGEVLKKALIAEAVDLYLATVKMRQRFKEEGNDFQKSKLRLEGSGVP